jgi:hypothetical protein
MLLHATNANQRADHAMKCVSSAPPDCATASWDILCERLDCRSFARSLPNWITSCPCSAMVSPLLTMSTS